MVEKEHTSSCMNIIQGLSIERISNRGHWIGSGEDNTNLSGNLI